jgi:hypothetical protein
MNRSLLQPWRQVCPRLHPETAGRPSGASALGSARGFRDETSGILPPGMKLNL